MDAANLSGPNTTSYIVRILQLLADTTNNGYSLYTTSEFDSAGAISTIFDAEIDALLPYVSLIGLIELTAIGLSLWGGLRMLRWFIERDTAGAGKESDRAARFMLGQVLLIVPGIMVLERFLLSRMPMTAFAAAMALVGGLLFAMGRWLPHWIRAFFLVFRRKVKVGDQVRVGAARGEVVELDLFRVELRADDGSRHHLPLHVLGRDLLIVSSPEQSYPVEFRLPKGLTENERLGIETWATICPYREAMSPVRVHEGHREESVLRFQAWSEAAAKEGEAYLRRALVELEGRKEASGADMSGSD